MLSIKRSSMKSDAQALWAQTRLLLWPDNYRLVSLPREQLQNAAAAISASGQHFAVLVLERDEVSLTVCEHVWQRVAAQLPSRSVAGPYRVITFDINLDLAVTGYLLHAAARLAEAGISIVPQCAYLKDHLLIKAEEAERAMDVLNQLIAECR